MKIFKWKYYAEKDFKKHHMKYSKTKAFQRQCTCR